eukprot:COSAG01_NODE_94_length_26962_cov_9.110933_32_plen_257_part_00
MTPARALRVREVSVHTRSHTTARIVATLPGAGSSSHPRCRRRPYEYLGARGGAPSSARSDRREEERLASARRRSGGEVVQQAWQGTTSSERREDAAAAAAAAAAALSSPPALAGDEAAEADDWSPAAVRWPVHQLVEPGACRQAAPRRHHITPCVWQMSGGRTGVGRLSFTEEEVEKLARQDLQRRMKSLVRGGAVLAWAWLRSTPHYRSACMLRVRVEIMGSQKCGTVGESQPVLMMINPSISTRSRTVMSASAI